MKRALIGLLAAALMAACSPSTEEAPAAEPAPVEMPAPETPPAEDLEPTRTRAETEAACTAQGGAWRPICRMQTLACVTTFEDAGKVCTDGSDCKSGRCLADGITDAGIETSGTCAANDDPCGCFTAIEDGKTLPGLCAD